MAKRLQKTTQKQYEELLRFLMNHKMIITGKTKPLETRKINNLWDQFASHINSKGFGPSKTAEQWRNVFTEWKTNTKRKSRQIHLALAQTGGGPPFNKKLTDLEEQLLQLLSKIHLGDTQVNETVIENAGITWVMGEEPVPPANFEYVDNSNNCGMQCSRETVIDIPSSASEVLDDGVPSEAVVSEEHVQFTPKTRVNKVKTTIGHVALDKNNKHDARYSNNILKSACEQFAEAQKLNIQNKKIEGENLQIMAETLNSMVEVLKERNVLQKERNEIEIEKVKVQIAKAKIKYFKVFGNLEGFNDFLKGDVE